MNSPKEKANELVQEIYNEIQKYLVGTYEIKMNVATSIALLEIRNIIELEDFSVEGREYYEQVKQEIENHE